MSKRVYKPREEEKSKQEVWGMRPLPTEQACAIYARQSTAAQIVNNPESAAMQTTELESLASRLGWLDNNVILYIENKQTDGRMRSASGTLRIDQRPGLNALMERIYNDEVKAILVYSESRLFRDEFQIQVNTFIKACHDHDVRVITPTYRYDFSNNRYDAPQFRRQCEIAADYITNHVKGLLHPAKERVSLRGQYDGRQIPVGYIIDRDKTSPTYKRYIVYEPHAKVVRWLFKQYRLLGGRFFALGQEVSKLPYLFPPFEPWVEKQKTRLTHKGEGYTIGRDGLMSILTNVAYLGYWMYKDQVVSKNNHEPIVSPDDFWYAFNRLSPITIDGEPNPSYKQQPVRYTQKDKKDAPNLLKGILTSPQGNVYTPGYRGKGVYAIAGDRDFGHRVFTQFDSAPLDKIFMSRLEKTIKERGVDVTNALMYALQARVAAVASIDKQVKEAEKRLARVERFLDTESPIFDTLSNEQVAEYSRQRNEILKTLESLNEKSKQEKQQQVNIGECQASLRRAQRGEKLEPQQFRNMLALFTKSITIEVVAPHWLRFEIVWAGPLARKDVGFIWRKWGLSPSWSDEEEQVLRELYPEAPRDEILERLPNRAWNATLQQARVLGIRRLPNMPSSKRVPDLLSLNDVKLAEELGLKVDPNWLDMGCHWVEDWNNNGEGSSM